MPSSLSLSNVLKPQAGWYRGEFHAHTNFSDGHYSPPELAKLAQAEGLDFFAITDHNTVDAYPKFGNVPDVLIIPGIEITMKEGHYNVFGLEGEYNWLPDVCVWPAELSGATRRFNTPSQLMQQAAEQGLLNSINHPLLPPWDWLDNSTDLRYVHCLEIWNDPTWSDNEWANPRAVAMWTRWLNAGYRITAIGGTDYHMPQLSPGYKSPQRLGLAGTYVYADELSGAAILAAVRQRRVYVTTGPQITFEATINGTTCGIGADLGRVSGEITFKASVSHPAPVQAQLIKNGKVINTATLADDTPWHPGDSINDNQSAWYRLDVRGQNQEIMAITNPVFAGPPLAPSPPYTYGTFVDKTGKSEAQK